MGQRTTIVTTLAQSTEGEAIALHVLLFYLGIPAFTLVAVGVACWIFWRAKQRDDERDAAQAQRPPKEKELKWRNARSS